MKIRAPSILVEGNVTTKTVRLLGWKRGRLGQVKGQKNFKNGFPKTERICRR
jgi:hypothetical protein